MLAGPSTLTYTVTLQLNGGYNTVGGVGVNLATNCQTDKFTMTGVPGATPPVICGTNSGYHGKLTNIVESAMKKVQPFWTKNQK